MANVRSLLDDHEAEIVSRIAHLRGELVPLERELMEVRLAKAALKNGTPETDQPRLFLPLSTGSQNSHVDRWRQIVVHADSQRRASPYARLTIKQLIKKALSEQFPDGATASQLLDLFGTAWGRTEIVRTSLSPQLSRLGADGTLFRRGQIWHLSSSGVAALLEKAATDS